MASAEKTAYETQLKSNPSIAYLEPFNMTCTQVPSKRAYVAGAIMGGQLYAFGGLDSQGHGNNDAWYRDPVMPTSSFSVVPRSDTSESTFAFQCLNKEWAIYEWEMHTLNDTVVRNWTSVLTQMNYLTWLTSGEYKMYVRATDPAGNKDIEFIRYQNVYDWIYVKAPPWGLIIGLICLFIVICIGIYLEIRRRRRKAALERYAMKRMRRKFKKEAREAGGKGEDWKKYQEEAIKKELAALVSYLIHIS